MWNDWLLRAQEHTKDNISVAVDTCDVDTCAVENLPDVLKKSLKGRLTHK